MIAGYQRRQPSPSELADLQLEIGRYLAAVEAFRAESCEPNWRPEAGCADLALPEVSHPGAVPSGQR